MLTSLAEAYRRGAQIVHVNPLIEAASRNTIVPHEILSMILFHPTRTGTLNIQPRIAGDMALLRGVAKHLLEAAKTDPDAIDWRFIEQYGRFRRLSSHARENFVGGFGAALRRRARPDPRLW
jgi:anaerobic selenocysteine-containing dehydrogenase